MKSPVDLPDDRIGSTEKLAQYATDLTDEEVRQVGGIIGGIHKRYMYRPNTVKNLEEMRDEVLTKLAEVNILATVDPTPSFYGEPPTVDILGKINVTDGGAFDHERKAYEVQKANELGEAYRGQKENPNKKRKRPKE